VLKKKTKHRSVLGFARVTTDDAPVLYGAPLPNYGTRLKWTAPLLALNACNFRANGPSIFLALGEAGDALVFYVSLKFS
jgi:hypothetical protein